MKVLITISLVLIVFSSRSGFSKVHYSITYPDKQIKNFVMGSKTQFQTLGEHLCQFILQKTNKDWERGTVMCLIGAPKDAKSSSSAGTSIVCPRKMSDTSEMKLFKKASDRYLAIDTSKVKKPNDSKIWVIRLQCR